MKADPFFLYTIPVWTAYTDWIVSNEAVFLCRISKCSASYFSLGQFQRVTGWTQRRCCFHVPDNLRRREVYFKILLYLYNDNDVSFSKFLIIHYETVLDFAIRQILHDVRTFRTSKLSLLGRRVTAGC